MSDLHLRVAKALGVHEIREGRTFTLVIPGGVNAIGFVYRDACWTACPRYDTDWAATGPLIERFQFMLRHFGVSRPDIAQEWIAVKVVESDPPGEQAHEADGATPLLAVCNLVLALHAAGKLPTPPPVPA